MAQLQLQPVQTGKKRPALKAQLKIDMTPMVDLGFLLITFFIFTTTMGEPHITKLYMPAKGEGSDLGKSEALTILLAGNDSVYYYHGKWEEAVKQNSIRLTNFGLNNGIGDVIRKKQNALKDKKENMMLLIKPLETSTYSSVMNSLDEVLINAVKKYAIIEPETAETKFVKDLSK
jgi:biopolymer transport protein ExbD